MNAPANVDRVDMPRIYFDAIAQARDALEEVGFSSEVWLKVIEEHVGRRLDEIVQDLEELLFDARPVVDPAEHEPHWHGGALGEDGQILFAMGEVDADELIRICDDDGGYMATMLKESDVTRDDVARDLIHGWFVMRAGVPGDDEITFYVEKAEEGARHAFRGTWWEV